MELLHHPPMLCSDCNTQNILYAKKSFLYLFFTLASPQPAFQVPSLPQRTMEALRPPQLTIPQMPPEQLTMERRSLSTMTPTLKSSTGKMEIESIYERSSKNTVTRLKNIAQNYADRVYAVSQKIKRGAEPSLAELRTVVIGLEEIDKYLDPGVLPMELEYLTSATAKQFYKAIHFYSDFLAKERKNK